MANVVNLYGSAAAIPLDELASMSKAQLVQCATILHSALTVSNKHRFAAERELKLMQAQQEGEEVSPEKKFICELEGKIHALETTLKDSQRALMRVAAENGYLKKFVNATEVITQDEKENYSSSSNPAITLKKALLEVDNLQQQQQHKRTASSSSSLSPMDNLPTIQVDSPGTTSGGANIISTNNTNNNKSVTFDDFTSSSSPANQQQQQSSSSNALSPSSSTGTLSPSSSAAFHHHHHHGHQSGGVVVSGVNTPRTNSPSQLSASSEDRSASSTATASNNNNNNDPKTVVQAQSASKHQSQQLLEEERRKLQQEFHSREIAQNEATKMLIRRSEQQLREQYEQKLQTMKGNASLSSNQSIAKIAMLEDELCRAKGELLEQGRAMRLREHVDVQVLRKTNEMLSDQAQKDREKIVSLKHDIALMTSKVREMESETEERIRDQMMERLDEIEDEDDEFLASLLPDHDMVSHLLSKNRNGGENTNNNGENGTRTSLAKQLLMKRKGSVVGGKNNNRDDMTNGGKIKTKAFIDSETQTESFMMRLVDVIKQREDELRSQKLENHSLTEQVLTLNRDLRDMKRENEELARDAKRYSNLVNEMQGQLKLERQAGRATLLNRNNSGTGNSSNNNNNGLGNHNNNNFSSSASLLSNNNNNNNQQLQSASSFMLSGGRNNSIISNNSNNNNVNPNHFSSIRATTSFIGDSTSNHGTPKGLQPQPSPSSVSSASFGAQNTMNNKRQSIVSISSEPVGINSNNNNRSIVLNSGSVSGSDKLATPTSPTLPPALVSVASSDFGKKEKSVGNFSPSSSMTFSK